MKRINVVLCSYSHGLGDGIAHMDASLRQGADRELFRLRAFVLRADFPAGRSEEREGAAHISLADAFGVLREEFRDADIVQVNGAFDPVAANAASVAGVPGIVEVMHLVETGGMHEGIDAVVCVSELVRSVQTDARATVIHNGIDTGRFSFTPGRRDAENVRVVQVANAAKALHYELADIARELDNPLLRPRMAGSRAPAPGVPSLGVVADMPAVYHDADLLFLIEKRSAFGLVFAEAMACGTLPVVSGDSGAAAFVRHGETGWVVDPVSRDEACRVLAEAAETVAKPRFLTMQRAARGLVESRFSTQHMLRGYQELWTALAARPAKQPVQAAAWMHLALFAQLLRHGNESAMTALEAFLAEPRPLEPSFLRHPMGQAALAYALRHGCPELLRRGLAPLVVLLCARLRRSRCASPVLDSLETQAKRLAAARM